MNDCVMQVNVGNKYNSDAGLADRCSARRGDFQSLPFEDAQFDAAYQIEATCHSPDKVWLAHLSIRRCCGCEAARGAKFKRVQVNEGLFYFSLVADVLSRG